MEYKKVILAIENIQPETYSVYKEFKEFIEKCELSRIDQNIFDGIKGWFEYVENGVYNYGFGNGYLVFDGIPDFDYESLNVYGGITLYGLLPEDAIERLNRDNELKDESNILTKEDIGKVIIGFDTGHFDSTKTIHTKEFIEKELDRLIEQLMFKKMTIRYKECN